MDPIHIRDDFVKASPGYISRSRVSYPNDTQLRLSFLRVLDFLEETERLHTGEYYGHLRSPFVAEYFSMDHPESKVASDSGEWLGHILVPAGSRLNARLNQNNLVLSGVGNSSHLQLVNKFDTYKDGDTTVVVADPARTYELGFDLPENISGEALAINEEVLDKETGFLNRAVRARDTECDGRFSTAAGFVECPPFLEPHVLYAHHDSVNLTSWHKAVNPIETYHLRFASYENPADSMNVGEESLSLVRARAGNMLRGRIYDFKKRLGAIKRVDSGATISERSLELWLGGIQDFSTHYFPEDLKEEVETKIA